jgi:hypothetical protein
VESTGTHLNTGVALIATPVFTINTKGRPHGKEKKKK